MPKMSEGKTMITALIGSNTFLASKELKKLTDDFMKANTDLAVERFDGEESSFEQMQASVSSQPFLSEGKLVILKSPGSSKQFCDNFESFLANVSEACEVIIVEPKPDRRSKYYKILNQKAIVIDCAEKDSLALTGWLCQTAVQLGGQLTPGEAKFLIDRLGPNQQMIYSDLQKLILYQPNITKQTIELLTDVTPQSDIFQLIETAFAGNFGRAIQIYEDQRQQKVEPQAILGMIVWQLHILALVKSAGNRTTAEIASQAKQHPYVIQKTQSLSRRISAVQLKVLIAKVVDLDAKIKSTNIDADDAIKQLITDIISV